VLPYFRRLLGGPAAADPTDGCLLRRFAVQRDGDAFAALLRRHGPMVLGVCRRVLDDPDEVEDVFQAAFLVLVRKAGSIRKEASVGSWLYGVAARLARRARADAARRRTHERQVVTPAITDDGLSAVVWRDLRPVLDEELSRLPEKYRAPLVLCYLEGQTHEEAARQLGCPSGTVCGRLARARDLLRGRLTRRGLALSAGLLGTLLAESAARAAVPAALSASTARLAALFAAESALAISARVAALADGALRAMAVGRLKAAAAVLLVLGLLTTGAGLFARQALTEPPSPAGEAREPKAPPRDGDAPRAVAEPVHTDALGDPLPPGAVARLGTVRFRHGEAVHGVAFSPDGKTIASGGLDGKVCLWDAATGKELRRFTAHPEWVLCVAYSPDGKLLAAAGGDRTRKRDGTVRLFDPATGKEVRVLAGHTQEVRALAFSPDGRTLVSGSSDKTVRLWDVTTGQQRRQLGPLGSDVWALAFSRDGKFLATGSQDGAIHLWAPATGEAIRKLDGHRGWVQALAFAPDGKTLVSGGDHSDPVARVWDVATAREVRRLSGQQVGNFRLGVGTLAFSPDGATLVSGGADGVIRFWDPATGKEVRAVPGHPFWVTALAFSPDGQTLASGSTDSTVGLWDAATGKDLRPLRGHRAAVPSLALSPDGRTLASGSWDRTIRLWDVATRKEVRQLVGHEDVAFCLAFTPDGRTLISGGFDGTVRLWDPATGKETGRFSDAPKMVSSLAFSPDGRTLAGGGDDAIRLWDPAGKMLRRLSVGEQGSQYAAFSPDGKTLAVTCRDRTITLFEVGTGQEKARLAGHEHWVHHVLFSPDGTSLASASEDRTVRLWDVATGKERLRLTGHEGYVCPLAFSPDGRVLMSGSGDRTIRFWELATGRERYQLRERAGWPRVFVLTPDGQTLFSGGEDSTILVWDLKHLGQADRPRPGKLSAREQDALWADLAGEDAGQAFRAMATLGAVPDQAAAMLRERLRPTALPDGKRVARLLAQLDDDQFAVREQAAKELGELGEAIEPQLRDALKAQPSAEVRQRLERLLARLGGPVTSPEVLRTLRGVEVLEQAGTPETRAVLEAMAGGSPDARLTREAKTALARLDHRR
jgi:RNA polymerase sigma factor (sigma-70 family)